MDSGPAKRRKLDHSQDGAEKALESAVSTGGVSRSRAFILEAEELLEEVRIDYKTAFEGADQLLHKIKGSIEAIKAQEPLPILEAATKFEKKSKIKIPFPDPQPPKNSNYKVAFAKPAQFNVVGSYVSKTMLKTQKDHSVDMIVVLPQEILQEKDYLDLRYFYKRAYYLAVVANALQKEFGSDGQLSYEYLNGNPLCPVLAIQPKAPEATGKESKGCLQYRIRVIPCAPEGFFPKRKLHLGASLVRRGRDSESETPAHPTAFYNSTVSAEGSFMSYLKLLRQTEKKCAAFKKACILGRTWLQQRGFGGDISKGGFGHFEWSVLLALLLQGGQKMGHAALSTSLSATQLFKAQIQFLSVMNFSEKACVLGTESADLEEYIESGPILYDFARGLNVAFKMGHWSAALLHQHAKWTRNLMSDSSADQFTSTFILRADLPSHTFDLFAHLNYSDVLDEVIGNDYSESRGRVWQLGSKVYRVLNRALGDKELGERARVIHIQTPEQPGWALSEKPKDQSRAALEVGVLFDPANMSRVVDKGPSAGATAEEKEECDRFRRFWGDKAELRRFERDTIRETLVWKSTTPFEICEEIMRYILALHLRIGHLEDDISFYGNGLVDLLSIKPADTTLYNVARKEFSTFERDIRNLDDLPLRVRQIAPVCPELRHASVKPPVFGSLKSGPQPMDCIISFEASGKWPESIAAIQRTKIAFLLMIGNLLENSKQGVKTHVGLEDAHFETENLAFLDVIYESGPAFRLRIHSDLEESLLERQVKDKTLEQYLRQRATTQLAAFRRLYTNLPLHSQMINTSITRFPALGPTIRLVKHWFNSHKLSWHFSEEFVELVVLHVFLCPYPWDAPSSPSTGFMRVLLFLSRWDWRSEALIVDSNGELTGSDRMAIATRLEAWRKIDPNMNHTVLFVATAQETSGTAWTAVGGEARPGKVVAMRMTGLAKAAGRVMREGGLGLDPRRLFVPGLREYDVLIHLNSKVVKSCLKTYGHIDPSEGSAGREGARFKNLDVVTGEEMLPLARHPGDVLMEQLERVYGGPLVFFRGGAEEDCVIGAIWNPGVGRRTFRTGMGGSYKPVKQRKGEGEEEEEKVEVELNKEGMVAEMARLGGDLVEKIEMK
ncbi:putative nucleolar protein 6 [Triangularia verruculosa]|uniref:U3 small nucleolar RNA-associated protein 22 n=1 Tax=Triangularia verruculosa TaxID=2587418 RepID=A0AAN6XQG0_9PEZI|nr:putative nucleolar protein 6 [Triangularia verruculosa]